MFQKGGTIVLGEIDKPKDTYKDVVAVSYTHLTREERSIIRSNGVISSGVGLIIVARVVSEAAENSKGLSFNDILTRVMGFDWSRSNNFFKGKILSDEGAIISSTNSINSTANALLKELFPRCV